MREKVGKSRNTVFFQWFGVPEGRKGGSLKRRVRSQLARWEMKKCTPWWREAHFDVKMYKTITFGPLLEVAMSKKCTPLWREAHFQVKIYKTPGVRTTFGSWDVGKVNAVMPGSTFPSQNAQSTEGTDNFWQLRCRKSARRCGAKHISKSKRKKTLRVRTTFGGSDVASLHYTTLHDTTIHSTPLRYTTPYYTPQHYNYNYTTTLHYTKLHYITLHYTPLHFTTLHYTSTTTPLHSTTLQYTTLHYSTLHSTTLQLQLGLHNYTPLHYTTLRHTTSHWMTLHHR